MRHNDQRQVAPDAPSELDQIQENLVWRSYAASQLILPRRVQLPLKCLIYQGKVVATAVVDGQRQVVERLHAGEWIDAGFWERHTTPIELRAASPATLCFVKTGRAASKVGPSPEQKLLYVSLAFLFILILWAGRPIWKIMLAKVAYGIASLHLEAGGETHALALLTLSVDLDPLLSKAYNDMGYLFYGQGRFNDASTAFHQAVMADPDFAVAQNNLGFVYLESEQLEQAQDALSAAVMLDPQSVQVWTNLGLTYHLSGRYDEAIYAYRTALRLAPDNVVAQANLGVLAYEQRDFSAAREYLEAALALRPDLDHARLLLAGIALEEEDLAKAWRQLEVTAPALANDPLLHFYLALWYEEADRREEAIRALYDVIALDPQPELASLARSHLDVLLPTDP